MGAGAEEPVQEPADERGGGGALILMTLVAAPAALALETLLRKVLFPPEFEEIRELLHPILTPLVWVAVVLTAVLGVAGLVFQRRLVVRAVGRIPLADRTPERVRSAEVGAFLLAASVPQVPAILATFGFMWGSSLTPTVTAIAVATVAIALQALSARSKEPK